MKFMTSLTSIFALIAGLALSNTSLAGTAGLTGEHSGTYRLNVKTTSGALMAISYKAYNWTWNFDAQSVTFQDGYIRSPMSLIPLKYKTHDPMTLTDNGDGTYTVSYVFQAFNPLYNNPQTATSTTFEITDNGSELEIITLDSDGDGIPGETIYGIFPYDIELDWYGEAQ